ncbi:MAG TPA: transglycosylase family protein [Acidimicrobiales bacterium]|nr:transglycosylase family protein [Acidimicrobiales bacterium]
MVVVLLALAAGTGPAGAGPIEDKQAEAASIAAKLDAQAQTIVELDKEHRRADQRLADAETAVVRAEADVAAADQRQAESRRLLAVHATEAYVGGGSVTALSQLAQATAADAGARRAYLGIATSDDLQALDRLRATRQDLQDRQKALVAARKAASDQADASTADLTRFQRAADAQRALLVKVNGDMVQLVAAAQAQRDAEAAQAAAARQATVATAPAGAGPASEAAAAKAPATTAAPGPIAAVAAAAAPVAASVLSPSNDSTFACIRQLESGDNYKAPGGGAYQFQDATWHSLGYSGTASDAPPAVQDEAARKLQARDGWSPWTTAALCGRV